MRVITVFGTSTDVTFPLPRTHIRCAGRPSRFRCDSCDAGDDRIGHLLGAAFIEGEEQGRLDEFEFQDHRRSVIIVDKIHARVQHIARRGRFERRSRDDVLLFTNLSMVNVFGKVETLDPFATAVATKQGSLTDRVGEVAVDVDERRFGSGIHTRQIRLNNSGVS